MVCYICGGNTQVTNSRHQRRSNNVWRRRVCVLCDSVFTTTESIDYAKSLRVRSPQTRQLEPFNRDRLLLSIYKSLGHRASALVDAAGLCETILAKATPQASGGVLETRVIAHTTFVALARFDTLAAQHYQAFHPAAMNT